MTHAMIPVRRTPSNHHLGRSCSVGFERADSRGLPITARLTSSHIRLLRVSIASLVLKDAPISTHLEPSRVAHLEPNRTPLHPSSVRSARTVLPGGFRMAWFASRWGLRMWAISSTISSKPSTDAMMDSDTHESSDAHMPCVCVYPTSTRCRCGQVLCHGCSVKHWFLPATSLAMDVWGRRGESMRGISGVMGESWVLAPLSLAYPPFTNGSNTWLAT